MADLQALTRKSVSRRHTITSTSAFGHGALEHGLAILDGRVRGAGFYVPPTRPRSSGKPGLGHGRHIWAGSRDAAEQGYIAAGYADAEDLRLSLQIVAPGHDGPLTRASIRGVSGFAVRSRFQPEADHVDLERKPSFRPLTAEWRRFSEAGAEPTACLLDYINHRADWAWCLERPEWLGDGDARKREYDRAARRFAELTGAEPDPEPLLQTFALPGACETRDHGGGRTTSIAVDVFSPASALGREPPRYGWRFEDLAPLAERIAATAPIDA